MSAHTRYHGHTMPIASSLFSRILVGVDESEPSNDAVTLAARLARDHDGRLFLCHSVFWQPLIVAIESTTFVRVDPAPVMQSLKEQGEALLAQAAVTAKRFGIEAQRCLVEGDPAESVFKCAGKADCSLIVMGTHGRRGLDRLVVGSTTEAVLRTSTIPVLTVRPGTTSAGETGPYFERIVVGIDDSQPSDAAIQAIFEFPAADRRHVLFCSVASLEIAIGGRGYYSTAMHVIRSEAQAVVEAAVVSARAKGIAAEGRVLDGDTGDALIAAARQEEADLIVVGCHGRRGLRRFFLGSVAERVVRTAPVPVLVVRAPLREFAR
jgi:nucleotide-binding universal stress UspA family protein